MLRAWLLVIAWAGALVAAVPAMAAGKVALVIGNDRYEGETPLVNASRDATLVASSLRAIGFTVEVASNVTKSDFDRALAVFRRQAAGADEAIIYYAGHAVEIAGKNWLIPVNAKLDSPDDAAFETQDLDQLKLAVANATGLKIVILDACRNNPFRARLARLGGGMRSISRGLARTDPNTRDMLIVYAAGEGQEAADGNGQNSPFATALAKRLGQPGAEVRLMFGQIADDVTDATGGRQTPAIYSSLGGRQFYLSGGRPGVLTPPIAVTGQATTASATLFVAEAEAALGSLGVRAAQASWENATNITEATDRAAAAANKEFNDASVGYAVGAAKFEGIAGLDPTLRRKLEILRSSQVLPAPVSGGSAQLDTITNRLTAIYGRGRGTLGGQPIAGADIEVAMATERDPDRLKEMWLSWHNAVGRPMRDDYARSIAIANLGAKDLGFPDVGTMWRSSYDMPPAAFGAMLDQAWTELEPLYRALHTYVRARLSEKYGAGVQAKSGPIRADLLGNMWAQDWSGLYDVVAPRNDGGAGIDIGALLRSKGYDPVRMVKTGEDFYRSLGLAPLPDTFWTRSQIEKPAGRDVVCHASAWDIDSQDDLRIKMCVKVTTGDFVTIHHELGHNFYQRAYKGQSYLFQNGANDGVHEAVGDMAALSVTPDYLAQIGLLAPNKVPGPDAEIGLLLRQALDKVAFLPFGLLVDKWRWGVFDGSITPGAYQANWDRLRRRYQGVVPPVTRDETSFDPGAKFHVASGTPYARYFVGRLLQFQLYQAACAQAGWRGPLHRCSFYGSKAVGAKLQAMMAMGASRPWPDTLATFTGSREISGKAMAAYFAPLKAWLDEQNRGQMQGW